MSTHEDKLKWAKSIVVGDVVLTPIGPKKVEGTRVMYAPIPTIEKFFDRLVKNKWVPKALPKVIFEVYYRLVHWALPKGEAADVELNLGDGLTCSAMLHCVPMPTRVGTTSISPLDLLETILRVRSEDSGSATKPTKLN